MKKWIVALILLLGLISVKGVFGIYNPLERENNKVGVHILFPYEVEEAASFVNSNGGDWGYVTIPIQSVDRDLEKWQKFMDDCKRLHIIPILRIATYPREDYWTKRFWYEEIDFANFLDSLRWPVENRYVIIYNEPNRANEWGGVLSPKEYARALSVAIDVFKRVNKNFFILPAGLDMACMSNGVLMDGFEYLRRMNKEVPGIFLKIDGWASHSYPNPGYAGGCLDKTRMSISGYQKEVEFLRENFGVLDLAVFITETGWRQDKFTKDELLRKYKCAFENVWNDKNVAAVTVFLFKGEGQFEEFSLLSKGKKTGSYIGIERLEKKKGSPKLEKEGLVAGAKKEKESSFEQVLYDNEKVFQEKFSNLVKIIFKFLLKWQLTKKTG